PTLFPSTTLFRSETAEEAAAGNLHDLMVADGSAVIHRPKTFFLRLVAPRAMILRKTRTRLRSRLRRHGGAGGSADTASQGRAGSPPRGPCGGPAGRAAGRSGECCGERGAGLLEDLVAGPGP